MIFDLALIGYVGRNCKIVVIEKDPAHYESELVARAIAKTSLSQICLNWLLKSVVHCSLYTGLSPWALFQYREIHLFSNSREISKWWDQFLKLPDRSEILQAAPQRCCGDTCQILERSDDVKPQSRSFELLRYLEKRRICLY